MQKHYDTIRNLYWHVRALRCWQQAKRRKLYRQIAKQKAALIAGGVDHEELRLWCRQYSNCYPEAAKARYEAYCSKKKVTIFENTRKA